MNRRTCRWLAVIGVVLLGTAASATAEDSIHKEFDVSAGGSLVIQTDVGSIDVKTSNGDALDVTVERSGPRADELDVDFSMTGNTVTVHGDFPGKWRWGRGPKVRFLVTIPREFNIDLQTAGGSIQVRDLEGEARVKTSGGSLDLGQIQGTVWGRTSGGSITLDGCSGATDVDTSGGSINIGDIGDDLKAHTSGGSITIGKVAGSVDAHTSGGSIRVAEVNGTISATSSGGSVSAVIAGQPTAGSRLKTSGGSVRATIASHLSLDISASCSGGRVYNDLDLGSLEQSKRSLDGTLNGGGPELVLHTSGGSVTIEGS